MTYTLGNKCAKNLCKRTVPLQLIIKNVVTCFLEHSISSYFYSCIRAAELSCDAERDLLAIATSSIYEACSIELMTFRTTSKRPHQTEIQLIYYTPASVRANHHTGARRASSLAPAHSLSRTQPLYITRRELAPKPTSANDNINIIYSGRAINYLCFCYVIQ